MSLSNHHIAKDCLQLASKLMIGYICLAPASSHYLTPGGWAAKALSLAHQKTHITYTIIDRQSASILGSTRLMAIRPEHRGVEIGYTWLGRDFQKSHVNTEAKLLLLQHCFETLGCIRVELKTDLRNHRSQTAIERIGAVKEGVFRQHMVAQDGYFRDTVYYSIIDADWPGIKKQLSARLADN